MAKLGTWRPKWLRLWVEIGWVYRWTGGAPVALFTSSLVADARLATLCWPASRTIPGGGQWRRSWRRRAEVRDSRKSCSSRARFNRSLRWSPEATPWRGRRPYRWRCRASSQRRKTCRTRRLQAGVRGRSRLPAGAGPSTAEWFRPRGAFVDDQVGGVDE